MNRISLVRRSIAATLVALLVPAAGCGKKPAAPPSELPTRAVSHWTATTELFMEHPPLVSGEKIRLAVHVTTLADFKPLNQGRPTIELRGADGKATTWPGSEPLRPGAFRVEGVVPPPGTYTWVVRVQTPHFADAHELGQVMVYPTTDAARAAADEAEGAPAIAYLKEQQWTSDFATVLVQAEPMRRSLRVPAVVAPPAGGEAVIAAPASGRLVTTRLPQLGDRVAAGALLARFEPRLTAIEDRALLRQQVAEARAALAGAEAERRRAQQLLAEKAVPARRLEDATRAVGVARAQVESAETRLAQRDETLRTGGAATGGNAFELRAPISGTVASVSATPGSAYEVGAELFRIVRTDRVAVEAHVPPSASAGAEPIADVALELPGDTKLTTLRVLGQARAGVIDPKLRTHIHRFEVDNADGRLLVGQAATAMLYLRESATVPVVPAAAILTDAGRPFLFVQVGGESFERRNVELGGRDGLRVAVLAGVKPGERVVTRGTYDVQLASAARGLPAEGHVH